MIKNWYEYGNDVLAVADGIAATTRGDFSESPTLAEHASYIAGKNVEPEVKKFPEVE